MFESNKSEGISRVFFSQKSLWKATMIGQKVFCRAAAVLGQQLSNIDYILEIQ